jgi:hypothetical protein
MQVLFLCVWGGGHRPRAPASIFPLILFSLTTLITGDNRHLRALGILLQAKRKFAKIPD